MKEYAYNDLIDKNIIPDDCEIFDCSYNKLNKLPELPSGLTELCCFDNNIIELPVLPSGLTKLYCNNNKLTALPKLPSRLKILCCDHNPIKHITPNMYSIMRNIYLTDKYYIDIRNTIFYDQSGCSSKAEFFGLE